jgi:hypothetical protein
LRDIAETVAMYLHPDYATELRAVAARHEALREAARAVICAANNVGGGRRNTAAERVLMSRIDALAAAIGEEK